MKDIFTVAKFTAKDMLGRKSFRMSTIIIMLFIIVGCNIPNFLNAINGGDFSDKVLITDQSNLYDGQLSALQDAIPNYDLVIENRPTEDIKNQIKDGELNSAIIIMPGEHAPHIEYVVKNAAVSGTIPAELFEPLNTLYRNLQISKLHLTPNQIANLTTPIDVEIAQVDEQQISGNIVAMMMLSIVLFYAIYFCAFQVSS